MLHVGAQIALRVERVPGVTIPHESVGMELLRAPADAPLRTFSLMHQNLRGVFADQTNHQRSNSRAPSLGKFELSSPWASFFERAETLSEKSSRISPPSSWMICWASA